jgi:pimeloyl-ACP methyl ester carboxylesterase
MMLAEVDVTTPDGRAVRAASFGPRDGVPVIWHHGNPGARVRPIAESVLEAVGVRLIAYDRPGGGKSTPRPGRCVADLKDDIPAIARAFGIERFGTAGISGGGAFALGTAALLPDQVFAAAVLSGAAPIDAEGLDFREGMSETNVRAADDQVETDRVATLAEMEPIRQEILADPQQALLGFAEEFPQTDRDALAFPEIMVPIANGMAECLRSSAEGWLDDSIAFARPWGFEVSAISAPVGIWQGLEDTATPIGHARWLARRIPGAELYELEGGHYAPYLAFSTALRWLAAKAA